MGARIRATPPEAKVELAHLLNASRRQLSHKDRKAAEKARDARLGTIARDKAAGMSTRAIAEKHDVSAGQVQRDLACSTVSGDTVEHASSDRVIGLDGRERPATVAKIGELSPAMPRSEMSRGKKKGGSPGEPPFAKASVAKFRKVTSNIAKLDDYREKCGGEEELTLSGFVRFAPPTRWIRRWR